MTAPRVALLLLALLVAAASCGVRRLNTVDGSGGAGGTSIDKTGGQTGGSPFSGATGGMPAGSGGASNCPTVRGETFGTLETLVDGDSMDVLPKFVPHFDGRSHTPQFVTMADLTGDGKLDLVVGESGALRLRPGLGDGTFGELGNSVLDGNGRSCTAVDLNGDGLLDLVVTPVAGSDAVVVHLNRGAGDMGPGLPQGSATSPTHLTPVVADFTGDGRPDVVVGGSETSPAGPHSIRLLVNNGVGTFRAAAESPTLEVPTNLLAGDADRDGRMDVLSLGPCALHQVLSADGSGVFAAPSLYATMGSADAAGERAGSAFGDLNGDGRADLVTTYGSFPQLKVMLNDGRGGFVQLEQRLIGWLGLVRLHDLNGDGKLDIVCQGQGPSSGLVVLLGVGDGHFSKAIWYRTAVAVADFAVADLNGDRKADIVLVGTGDTSASGITILINSSP